MDPLALLGTAAGVVVALGVIAKWIWPTLRDFFAGITGAIETINGRPAKLDKAKREMRPAVPSLTVQLADLAKAVSDQTEQNKRLTALETLTAEHGQRLTAIEAGHQIERSLGHVAQAKTMDALEAVARKSDDTEK